MIYCDIFAGLDCVTLSTVVINLVDILNLCGWGFWVFCNPLDL